MDVRDGEKSLAQAQRGAQHAQKLAVAAATNKLPNGLFRANSAEKRKFNPALLRGNSAEKRPRLGATPRGPQTAGPAHASQNGNPPANPFLAQSTGIMTGPAHQPVAHLAAQGARVVEEVVADSAASEESLNQESFVSVASTVLRPKKKQRKTEPCYGTPVAAAAAGSLADSLPSNFKSINKYDQSAAMLRETQVDSLARGSQDSNSSARGSPQGSPLASPQGSPQVSPQGSPLVSSPQLAGGLLRTGR